jgi:hypothetical protein
MQQRLRVEVGQKVTPSKAGQEVDIRADLLVQRAALKSKLPHLAGGGADQTELQQKDNTVDEW